MSKKRIVLAIAIAYLVAMMIVSFIGGWNSYQPKELSDFITTTITKVDGTVETGGNSFIAVNRGDKVVATIDIPYYDDISTPALCFEYYNATMRISFEGNELYRKGFNRLANNEHIGANFVNLELPREVMGKTIEVEFVATELNAFNNLDFTIMEARESAKFILPNHSFDFIMYLSVLFISFILTVVFVLSLFNNKLRKDNAIHIALCQVLILFTLSLYCLSTIGAIHLLSYNTRILNELEYIALFLLPVIISLYCYKMYQKYDLRKIALVGLIIFSSLFVLTTILNFFTRIHYNDFIIILLVLCLIIGGVLVVKTKKVKFEHPWQQMIEGGSVLLMFAIFGDILIYLSQVVFPNGLIKYTLVPLGLLFMLSGVIGGMILRGVEATQKEEENKMLEHLAYVDQLTGLSNRAKGYQVIEEIKKNNIKDFAVVFIDLNNLKKINDFMGHDRGDEYITRCADIISWVYQDATVKCRFGGDEFVVIYRNGGQNASLRTSIFHKEITKLVSCTNCDFVAGAAVGVSISTKEEPLDIYDALKKADEKMYQDKMRFKEK